MAFPVGLFEEEKEDGGVGGIFIFLTNLCYIYLYGVSRILQTAKSNQVHRKPYKDYV